MGYDRRKPREPQLYANNQIKAPFMILVDESGKQLGKFPRRRMVEMSEAKGLDIIQLHYDFNEKVATVRLVDLGKYLYEKQKTKKEKKKTQKKQGLKQVKFGYGIGDNDLEMKKKKMREFLGEGYSVKVTVRLRGRERIYASKVKERLLALQQEMEDAGRPQYPVPKYEGSSFVLTFLPKRSQIQNRPKKKRVLSAAELAQKKRRAEAAKKAGLEKHAASQKSKDADEPQKS